MTKFTKTALITGSKEGIGFQTTLILAQRGWRVIMADKLELAEAKNAIIAGTTNHNVYSYHVDLADFASIRNLCKKLDKIDVLINNAGIFEAKEQSTVDGHDPVMQVNVLGPFLLTVLLTDSIRSSPNGRVIFLSSSGAFLHNFNPTYSHLTNANKSLLDPIFNYYNSKLYCMVISRMFGKKLQKWGVTCNCVHPGMTGSNFLFKQSGIGYWSPIGLRLLKMFIQDPATSAEGVAFLATSMTLKGTTGEYFENFQVHEVPKIVKDWQFCEEVWQRACELTKVTDSEIGIYK